MKREIKFRVWILTKKEEWTGADNFDTFDWDNRMRFVSYMNIPLNNHSGKDISCHKICENDNYANEWHAVGEKYNEAILMQYTGLKDKNGKEIFEGDICVLDYSLYDEYEDEDEFGNEKFKFVVEFEDGSFWNWCEDLTSDRCEVIGNIYENPNLLKQK